ncbi:hypothetical protein C483_07584 [Natrialba hulunbeirensis JCM 10989]|uniref:Uncharacterized protein n=1 Tax=Natrialba hulunbeirensis JCM 10989 TaxID=1227493 RepID=M0A3X7_9EURY|nr:hypothetical protein [Natrialba hulunbeirensis]ELY92592.1 hypothetical protein C483_07584 [Natrialba hulunbeirensis JCM 10989]
MTDDHSPTDADSDSDSSADADTPTPPNSNASPSGTNGDESGGEASGGEVEIEVTRGATESRDRRGRPDRTARTDRPDPDGRASDTRRDGSPDSAVGDANRSNAAHHPQEGPLADELGRIDVMTTPEGYVEGRIADVIALDETTVELTVSLPHGEVIAFELEKPIPWSEDFLFARLIEDVGYDAASIDHAIGEPVYLARTDLPAADTEAGTSTATTTDDWWTSTVHAASDAVLSSLSRGRYRLERADEPEWRLVDPLERPDAAPETEDDGVTTELVGTGLILFGTLVAAAGAVFGATGTLVVSSAVLAYALLGVLLVLAGIVVVLDRDVTNL